MYGNTIKVGTSFKMTLIMYFKYENVFAFTAEGTYAVASYRMTGQDVTEWLKSSKISEKIFLVDIILIVTLD